MDTNGSGLITQLKRLFNKESATPINHRREFVNSIRHAHTENLIAEDTLGMLEGVLQVEDQQAEDIMIPRSQITFIQRDDNYREILQKVLEAGHSRYPVIDENRDDIDGILHAKDLLQYIGKESTFDIDDLLRQPIFATENTRLNELLTNFKKSRNHMAVILDEYAGLCGIVTIEDVLEQIVGEIDDEHDSTDEAPNISKTDKQFTINATTSVEEFNSYFNSQLLTEQFDTIGGIVSHKLGRIPQKGDKITLAGLDIVVASSDGRRILSLKIANKALTAEGKAKKTEETV